MARRIVVALTRIDGREDLVTLPADRLKPPNTAKGGIFMDSVPQGLQTKGYGSCLRSSVRMCQSSRPCVRHVLQPQPMDSRQPSVLMNQVHINRQNHYVPNWITDINGLDLPRFHGRLVLGVESV